MTLIRDINLLRHRLHVLTESIVQFFEILLTFVFLSLVIELTLAFYTEYEQLLLPDFRSTEIITQIFGTTLYPIIIFFAAYPCNYIKSQVGTFKLQITLQEC